MQRTAWLLVAASLTAGCSTKTLIVDHDIGAQSEASLVVLAERYVFLRSERPRSVVLARLDDTYSKGEMVHLTMSVYNANNLSVNIAPNNITVRWLGGRELNIFTPAQMKARAIKMASKQRSKAAWAAALSSVGAGQTRSTTYYSGTSTAYSGGYSATAYGSGSATTSTYDSGAAAAQIAAAGRRRDDQIASANARRDREVQQSDNLGFAFGPLQPHTARYGIVGLLPKGQTGTLEVTIYVAEEAHSFRFGISKFNG